MSHFKKELNKLSIWFQNHGFNKLAQEIKELADYEESWHEEAVQEFGGEPISEEEYFSQEFEATPKDLTSSEGYRGVDIKDAEIFKAIADQEGFQVLSHNSFLGRGSYGAVYRGVYNGQPAAMKIILGEDIYDKEIENWRQILKAAKKMPPEFQKHIPKVYRTNRSQIDIGSDEPIKYSVVIMEELLPLAPEIKAIVDQYERNPESRDLVQSKVKMITKDPEFLYAVAQKLLQNPLAYLQSLTPPPTAPELMKVIMNADPIKKSTMAEDLSDYLFAKYKNNAWFRSRYDSPSRLRSQISFALQEIFSLQGMPSSPANLAEMPAWKALPETRSFYETIEYLAKNFEIFASDIHRGNVLMDREGNLKIIDVGLYSTDRSGEKLPTEETKSI